MSRLVRRSQSENNGGSDKFGSVSTGSRTDVQSLHAEKESEGHLSWYAAFRVCHSSFILVHLGKLRVVRHAKSAGSSLSFHNWNVHDSVKELKPGNSKLQHFKHIDDLVDESAKSLRLHRGVAAVVVVMLLLVMSCC